MRFKFFWLLTVIFCDCLTTQAQIIEPAKWHFSVSEGEVIIGGETTLEFNVELDDTWQLYSTDLDPEVGPIPAKIEFEPHPSYALVGDPVPMAVKQKFDEIWLDYVRYLEKKGAFHQKIKILSQNPVIKGIITYQVCTTVDGMCVNPEEDFEFSEITVRNAETTPPSKKLDSSRQTIEPVPTREEEPKKEKLKKNKNKKEKATTPPSVPPSLLPDGQEGGNGAYLPSSGKTEARGEHSESFSNLSVGTQTEAAGGNSNWSVVIGTEEKASSEIDRAEASPSSIPPKGESGTDSGASEGGLLPFMLLAFASGLAALLTPCVFPMIPLTLSFFGKSEEGNKAKAIKKASIYGLSIIGIYVVAGSIVAQINGPEFANWLSTHWVPNIFFFLIFMLFSASFLGMFDLTLPSSWANAVDQASEKGGMAGVFFMASTLVLVSFSCTGPIVGNVLVLSAGGQVIKPVAGMFAFSAAIAAPFSAFAAFPRWLNALPRSGSWLNSVKVVLGFLELALGLKFLSVADQIYHWGILDREVYLALWIVIFTLLGLYLLGIVRLPRDQPLQTVGVPRLIQAIITFAFVVHLVPGMFGAPLKALSGYLPPMTSQEFVVGYAK